MTPHFTPDSHPQNSGGAASLPESEDMIRNLKSSESVVAAFQAAGFPSPPGELAQIATTYVKSQTLQIPINQVANMAAGSGQLGASAAQSVNLLIGTMTPMQREAMKAGVNPLDPAAVLRSYALNQGLPWAANNPEVLRLGPAAIATFGAMQFQRESYRTLREDAGAAPKQVYRFVAAAQEGRVSPEVTNDIAKSIGETAKGLSPEQQRALIDQWTTYLGSLKASPEKHAEEKKKLEQGLNQLGTTNPAKAPHIERQKKFINRIEAERAQTNDATHTADEKTLKAASAHSSAGSADAATDALLRGSPDPTVGPGNSHAPRNPTKDKKPEHPRPPKTPSPLAPGK